MDLTRHSKCPLMPAIATMCEYSTFCQHCGCCQCRYRSLGCDQKSADACWLLPHKLSHRITYLSLTGITTATLQKTPGICTHRWFVPRITGPCCNTAPGAHSMLLEMMITAWWNARQCTAHCPSTPPHAGRYRRGPLRASTPRSEFNGLVRSTAALRCISHLR